MAKFTWLDKLLRRRPPPPVSSRQAPVALVEPIAETQGVGSEWARLAYAEYYAKSVPVYAAIQLRSEAVSRPPLLVHKHLQDGGSEPVGPEHPFQVLLDKVNEFWTGLDLRRATEAHLCLFGSAFWLLRKTSPSSAPTEIWVARPDRVRIMADRRTYIRGYRYTNGSRSEDLRPDEVVWFRFFNPLDELAGLSPVGVLKLSADMGMDALRHNRNVFKNGLLFGNVAITTETTPSPEELQDFYDRLRKRFASPENSWKPMVLGNGMDAKNLGFSQRDMEHIQTLRWTLEDVARVYQIPKIMLGDLERSTFANVDAAERIFWRGIASHLQFIEAEINEMLAPQFGPDLFVEHDLSQIEALQPDSHKEWETLRANIQVGSITINEARKRMQMDPVPWGDTWWAPFSLTPVQGTRLEANGEGEEASFRAPYVVDLAPNGYRMFHNPALAESNLLRLWQVHDRRLTIGGERFGEMQSRLFRRQEKEVLRRLRSTKSMVSKQLLGDLFTAEEWLAAFIRAGGILANVIMQQAASDAVAEFGLGIAFDVTHPAVQEWLADRLRFWAGRVNEETAKLLMGEMEAGRVAGESIPELQKRVEKVFDFSDKVRSERIARTEVQAHTNRAAIEAYRQSTIVEQKMWLATLDDRVRDAHREAHGQTVLLDAKFLVGGEMIDQPGDGSPENAINCFIPTVSIRGRITMGLKAWYSGQVRQIKTRSGNVLTVTPNHPVLTKHGFWPAKQLEKGVYLVSYKEQIPDHFAGLSFDNEQDSPPSSMQVFNALIDRGRVGTAKVMSHDLHGDAARCDGQVQVVRADSILLADSQTTFMEDISQLILHNAPSKQFSFHGDCPSDLAFKGIRLAPATVPSGSHLPLHEGRVNLELLPFEQFCGASPTYWDAHLVKPAGQDRAGDAAFLAQLFERYTSQISLDEIIEIRDYQFSGHVYDFQTTGGWIIAENILCSNCRCATIPVLGKAFRKSLSPDKGDRTQEKRLESLENAVLALAATKTQGPKRILKRVKRDAAGFPTEVEEVHENG